jgi:peptidoglycan/LPS O-acetylase OafA/YrhL
MDYRRDIDGLRALAVLPVIFYHAGFEVFSGGFVGVDIFFVISGYLITTIIFSELAQGKFSIANFYERRARRILPALFLVMLVSLIFGYFWLMPDEFKNLGQSLVATSLFSNNMLLGLTSGYWDLASEFKPLLHTWSLGVEEQYYVIVPVLLMVFWKVSKNSISYLLWFIFLGSLFFSVWFVNISPDWAFYILPTRAWEIGIGALGAYYTRSYRQVNNNDRSSGFLAIVGLFLILFSIFTFDKTVLSPSYLLLIPTLGALLIIIFCRPGSIVFHILGNKVVVFLGLLSYSLYLWHQPVFAYLRVYSQEHLSSLYFLSTLPLVFILSFCTLKFVENPFRNKAFIGRKSIFTFSIVFSFLFVVIGLYLNKSYGMPQRVFASNVAIADMDKRIYNEKVFAFKKLAFTQDSRRKHLVIGNSFARDFINITLENFNVSDVEIIYRDDLKECIHSETNKDFVKMFFEADVIVFASGSYNKDCYLQDISFAVDNNKQIYYVGTKDFGYNLNWLIQLSEVQRRNQFNAIPNSIINAEEEMNSSIPSQHYISLLTPTLVDGEIPITDNLGRMLSTDRRHLTKYGAIYFGEKAVKGTLYSELFK